MRNRISPRWQIPAFAVFGVLLWGTEPTLADARPDQVLRHVYNLTITDCPENRPRQATGFRIAGEHGLYTALHAIAGCNSVEGSNPVAETKNVLKRLKPCWVSLGYDLAVLHEGDCPPERPKEPNAVGLLRADLGAEPGNTYSTPVFPVGERLGVVVRPFLRMSIRQLGYYQPPQDQANRELTLETFRLKENHFRCGGKSPSSKAVVIPLDAGLAPGHSGAPVLNSDGKVVGMVGGGWLRLLRVRGLFISHGEVSLPEGINWAFDIRRAELTSAKEEKGCIDEIGDSHDDFSFLQGSRDFVNGVEFIELADDSTPGRFLMMAAEATNADYLRCSQAPEKDLPCSALSRRINPATMAMPVRVDSRGAAQKFCRWVGSGRGRLPTRFEWELAATAGLASGDSAVPGSCKVNAVSRTEECPLILGGHATPVRLFPSNRAGFYDLFGNMWEWVCEGPGCACPGSEEEAQFYLRGGGFDVRYKHLKLSLERLKTRRDTRGVRCVIVEKDLPCKTDAEEKAP